MNYQEDTIAAISTAQAPAGIGIVRISGEGAIAAADRIYQAKTEKKLADQKANTIHYGWIKDGESVIDEVLVMLFRAPHSYTGEDVVEIQCHGGIIAVGRILEAVLGCGVRSAEPGEFTKRAYLNGRIDLSRAEAVMDLISAKSRYAQESSAAQLAGKLEEKIKKTRDGLLEELAFIESALDDPEHYSLDGMEDEIKQRIIDAKDRVNKLLSTSDRGKYIGEGIKTVILGKPNAGKSSVLNAIMGSDRAIVTKIAGTTRDILRETVQIGGTCLVLSDTAGIRQADNEVEKIGIERTKEEAKNADLVLYVADSSEKADESDLEILDLVSDKKVIIILNKTDLETKTTAEDIKKICTAPVVETSAVNGEGIEELKDLITKMFFYGELSFNDEVYITNIRHEKLLEEVQEYLTGAIEAIEEGIPEDVYAADLYGAVRSLDLITGGNVSEDLVDTIFEKFCMGK